MREDFTMRLSAIGVMLTLAILWAPLTAQTPPAGKVPRLGLVFPAESPSPEEPNLAAFREALRHLGYVEGRTVALEYRYALERGERFPDLVTELIRLKVDILIVGATRGAVTAQQATRTIPIIFVGTPDPVGSGLVASLARPGGNMTGLSFAFNEGFGGKWVELLKEAVPAVAHVAYLQHASTQLGIREEHDIAVAAQALGLTLQPVAVSEPAALDGAFALMTEQHAGVLIVSTHPFFYAHRKRVADLAAQHQLPAIYGFRDFVNAGGLMSYGINIADLWRRAATYVDKILKGATPADLPVEQPMKFELVINLKTAQALGLTIPPTLLFQAAEVIR
jgi:putative ABC transport system substrate-binding protein